MSAGLGSFKSARVVFVKLSHPPEAWEVKMQHHNIYTEQDVAMETVGGTDELISIYGKKRIVGGISFTMIHIKRTPALIDAFQNRQIDILEITTAGICQRYKKIHPRALRIEPPHFLVFELMAEEVEYLEAKDQIKIDIETPHIKPLGKLSPSKSQKLIHNHATDALKYALNPDDPGLDEIKHLPTVDEDILTETVGEDAKKFIKESNPIIAEKLKNIFLGKSSKKPKKKKRRGRRILP